MPEQPVDRLTTRDVIVDCQGVCLDYLQTRALAGVDLQVRAGEQIAIMGPSGSGKSSLLYCIAGLEQPTHGSLFLSGRSLGDMPDSERSAVRLREMGLVFQSSELVAELTLAENVALPLQLLKQRGRVVRERCNQLIDELGLEGCRDRRPHEVSGGQRQRAAIARAVATSPRLLLADEPTGALDSDNRESVLRVLLSSAQQVGAALLVVTHDPAVSQHLGRMVSLADGKVVDDPGASQRRDAVVERG